MSPVFLLAFLAASVAARVGPRGIDSSLRCIQPDNPTFVKHAKFCSDITTWDVPYGSEVSFSLLDARASQSALSALGCPSLASHAFECARVFPRCTPLSSEMAKNTTALFVASLVCVSDCLDMKRMCSPFAEAYMTGVDCYGAEFDPDFRTCFALPDGLKAPCSLIRTVGREFIIFACFFILNMLALFLRFMLQRIAHARAHARLLREKHPFLNRSETSSRISLLSSVLEDDDMQPPEGTGQGSDQAKRVAHDEGRDVEGGGDITQRRECRICKLGDDDMRWLGGLIEPCGCSGSMRFVHTKCLQRWLEVKRKSTGMMCEVCGCCYNITMNRRCHLQPNTACTIPSIVAFVQLLIALTLAPIIPVINWLVCEGRSQGEGTRGESMLVLFSEVLMVGIYYYTLLKLVNKIWQSNSSIEIAGPSSPPPTLSSQSPQIEMQCVRSSSENNSSSSSSSNSTRAQV